MGEGGVGVVGGAVLLHLLAGTDDQKKSGEAAVFAFVSRRVHPGMVEEEPYLPALPMCVS